LLQTLLTLENRRSKRQACESSTLSAIGPRQNFKYFHCIVELNHFLYSGSPTTVISTGLVVFLESQQLNSILHALYYNISCAKREKITRMGYLPLDRRRDAAVRSRSPEQQLPPREQRATLGVAFFLSPVVFT
jgi:hypothetical protein